MERAARGAIAAEPHSVRLIPWIELNVDDRAQYDNIVTGLHIWERVTDTALVSTTPENGRFYGRLRRDVPGMQIIPGLKTVNLLHEFDDPKGWERVAREVEQLCAATGQQRCLLENESALEPYWNNKAKLDFAKLKEGLKRLPPKVEIWWYPSFVTGARTAERHKLTTDICEAVQAACDARFVDSELAKPPSRNDWWHPELATIRDRIARKPTVPILYFCDGGRVFWNEPQIREALARVRGPEAIIYSGAKRWIGAATDISAILKPAVGAAREP